MEVKFLRYAQEATALPEESHKRIVRKAFKSFDGEGSVLRGGEALLISTFLGIVVWVDRSIG